MSELVHVRKTCRCCGSDALTLAVPLTAVPVVSPNVAVTGGLTRTIAPLDNYLCGECGLIQLIHVVDPALIYRNYLYRTSISLGLPDHFRSLAESVVSRLEVPAGGFVVEFGSNDGTLLRAFKELGAKVQGVDPATAIAAEATRNGVPTLAQFFNVETAEQIVAEHGRADAIVSNNAMANIDDLDDIVRGVRALLSPDGAFIFETQYALDVFEKTLLDVIYHEHISCFSVRPVVALFRRWQLEVFDAERIPTKGGSIRFWVQHQGGPRPVAERVGELIELERRTGLYDPAYLARFGARVADIKERLTDLVREVKAKGGKVAAYGTSVGCAALIHQFELQHSLDFLLDDTPFKDHIDGPDYTLPVYSAEGVYEHRPDLIIILAWRYAAPILAKHQRYKDDGGRFVVPLPEVAVL